MDNPTIAIIILNWNGWEDTLECLESLYQITYPRYDVIVVDNGSEDDSIEKIKEYAEGKIEVSSKFFEFSLRNKPIKFIEYTREEAEAGGGKEKEITDTPSNRRLIIIKNEKNYGFAEGNNIGMRYALKALKPDYVLLLNNDTVVDKVFLTKLIKVAKNNNTYGVLGPKIYYYTYSGREDVVWFDGGKILWWFPLHYQCGLRNVGENFESKIIKKVDFITGTSILIKKKVLESISLPTEYFMQYEDLDFCQHVVEMNYQCVYVPNAKVWHKISASYKKPKLNCLQIKMSFRNSIIFYKKFAPKYKFTIILANLILIKFPIFVLYKFFIEKDRYAFKCALKGIFDGLYYIASNKESRGITYHDDIQTLNPPES